MEIFKCPKLRSIQDILIQQLDLPDNFFDINMNVEVKMRETDEILCRESYLKMRST